jgi:hypothetical protein
MRMDKLTRLRHAQQRIVRVQRRVWPAQVLIWPTVIAAGVSSVGGLVWILRRRYAGGRHEMPDTPGAHEVGTVQIEPDGRLSPRLRAVSWRLHRRRAQLPTNVGENE